MIILSNLFVYLSEEQLRSIALLLNPAIKFVEIYPSVEEFRKPGGERKFKPVYQNILRQYYILYLIYYAVLANVVIKDTAIDQTAKTVILKSIQEIVYIFFLDKLQKQDMYIDSKPKVILNE